MTMSATGSPSSAKMRHRLWGLLALLAFAAAIAGFRLWHRQAQSAVLRADPAHILDQPALRRVALDGGREVFKDHCASCHGPAGKGDARLGAADLTDSEYLYGTGTVAQIEDIARYGIRSGNKHGWNLAVMPAYGRKITKASENQLTQSPAEIGDLVQYILSFTARATDMAAVERGAATYTKAGCWDCHGRDLGGDPAIGAPALTDSIWLYGGSADDIGRTISRGRAGMSPAFARTITPSQLRNVAVYVASLAPIQQDRK